MTGPMETIRTTPVVIHPAIVGRTFPKAPLWWDGDEDASIMSQRAMTQL